MQFDSISESSYRSFLQNNYAALGNHLSKNPRYVYLFFYFSVYMTKSRKTDSNTVLILYCFFCSIFSLKPTYSGTLNINIFQSGLTVEVAYLTYILFF